MFAEFTEVATGYPHSFCLLVCKKSSDEGEDAANQACRGGSALVMSRILFNEQPVSDQMMNRIRRKKSKGRTTDPKSVASPARLGADLESFAFSIVLTSRDAEI